MSRVRRPAVGAALVVVGVLSALPVAGAANQVPTTAPAVDEGNSEEARIPASLRGATGAVSVMIELDAVPASRAYVDTAGQSRSVRTQATEAAVETIQRLQTTTRARLSAPATRATVLYETSRVYAGIAVTTDASRLAAIASMPGVRAIHRLVPKTRSNLSAVPLVGAPSAWVDAGLTGAGITIGIIDTGIDYTHAMFGGPGTTAAFEAATAAKRAGEPAVYPDVDKVAGGRDFVGDDYDADNPETSTPAPDDNPLDCEGHGTHVGGTAGGYGVNADGSTYDGPWNASTPFDTMAIGPGVAPEATLYALKVFGCEGSTNAVTEALDWAADPNGDGDLSDHLDVVNMSLGADFGSPLDPDSVASNNLVDVGVSVVAAAGNAGDLHEILGSPGIATKVISVAASEDSTQIVDGFTATIDGIGATYPASVSDAYDWAAGPGVANATVVQLADWTQAPSADNNTDGCDTFDSADAASAAGKVVLLKWDSNDNTRRCGSAARSANAVEAGAVGAILASTETLFSTGITGSDVIPVVLAGALATTELHEALLAGDEVTATLDGSLRNTVRIVVPEGATDPTDTMASFTSRGTALVDNVKPDVSAPGGSIFSAHAGTGSEGVSYSGTSMATPMTAGVTALMVEAHPTWTAAEIKAGLMNTARHYLYLQPGRTGPRYDVLRAGAGRIDAIAAVDNDVIAYVVEKPGAVSASFGVMNVRRTTTVTRTIRIADKRASGASTRYAVALDKINSLAGAKFTVSPTKVTLSPGATADVTVTLTVDPTKLVHKADPTIVLDPLEIGLLRDHLTTTSALVTVTPPSGGHVVRVPVFAAPRPAAKISGGTTVTVKGSGALQTGRLTLRGQEVDNVGAAPYERVRSRVSALQLAAKSAKLPKCRAGISTGCWATKDQRGADVRYLGVTTDARIVAADGGDPLSADAGAYAYFGVSTWGQWRTAANLAEFDIYVDSDNDGNPDLVLFNYRLGETDLFVAVAVSLRDGDEFATVGLELINNVAGDRDTAKLHSNAMVLPLSIGALANPTNDFGDPLPPFIAKKRTTVSYWVESYDAAYTLVDAIGHPRVPLRVNLTAPALTAFDAEGNMPTRATDGKQLKVTLDPAAAGDEPTLLLLHHLNSPGRRAELVAVTAR